MNMEETKVLAEDVENLFVKTLDGVELDVVADFNYLGAWIASAQKEVRRACAWSALYSVNKVWRAAIDDSLKGRFIIYGTGGHTTRKSLYLSRMTILYVSLYSP